MSVQHHSTAFSSCHCCSLLDIAQEGHETASLSLVSSLCPIIGFLGLPSYKHHLFLLAQHSTLCCSAERTVHTCLLAILHSKCVPVCHSSHHEQSGRLRVCYFESEATLTKFNREAIHFATDNRVGPLMANAPY